MKKIAAASVMAMSALSAEAETIRVTPNSAAPATIGAPQNFAGQVVVSPMFAADEFTHGSGGLVTFSPGARTVWHTHPAGQILIVTTGKGWVQEEGGAKREIKPGDTVWIPAGVKHWHGATDTTLMAHIALTYVKDGKAVDWLEQVSDDLYRK